MADLLRGAGEEIVILWGERLTAAPNADAAASALLDLADELGAKLLEIPSGANGRGLREVGFLPNAGPGYSAPAAAANPEAARAALYLLQVDPLRDLPRREGWEHVLDSASTVIAHASFLTEGIAEHADVVFPAESYAEKEGTIVHPDGRLQRLRPAIARPGQVCAGWQVLAELSARIGHDTGVLTGAMASQRVFDAVPFYAGLTLEELAGRGVRWQERSAADAFPQAGAARSLQAPEPPGEDACDQAGYRSVWDSVEVEHSPALEFLHPRRQLVAR
jgi:NADH-quinone oxidoreductase subunit G